MGEHALTIRFAGGEYVLRGLAEVQVAALLERFGDLVVGDVDRLDRCAARKPTSVLVGTTSQEVLPPLKLAGELYPLDLRFEPDMVLGAGPQLLFRFPREGSTEVWTSVPDGLEFSCQIENVLRVKEAYRAVHQGSLVVHSAAVVRDGRAYVFFGASGAGKSTLCTVSERRGLRVLSDELNLLDREERDGRVCCVVKKLPFAGDFGDSRGAGDDAAFELCGLFKLEQTPEHRIGALGQAEAVASMVAASPFVNGDPLVAPLAFDIARDLVLKARPRRLGFHIDPGFWDLI